jgi:hypothetical protein
VRLELAQVPRGRVRVRGILDLVLPLLPPDHRNTARFWVLSTKSGSVSRSVFLARHAGLRSDGMGTVSDDIGSYESTRG